MYEKKVAIVAGGASGIGKALCEELAKRGSRVIIADVNHKAAEELSKAILSKGRHAEAFYLDVTDFEQVRGIIDHVARTYGRIDFLINSAGIAIGGEAYHMDMGRWQKIVNVNLWGAIYASTEAYKQMIKQGSGHIVNISSGAGLFPNPMKTAYSTTKYGVVGFSTSLRPEAEVYGVKVSVVCPGPVRTPIFNTIEVVGAESEAVKKEVVGRNKWMEPDKAARIILKGVEKNKAIIPVTSIAAVLWRYYSHFPRLYEKTIARKMVQANLQLLKKK